MERKTQTTFDKLQVGDRFVKLGDRKQEVWEKADTNKARKDGAKHAEKIPQYTPVIFLRHQQD